MTLSGNSNSDVVSVNVCMLFAVKTFFHVVVDDLSYCTVKRRSGSWVRGREYSSILAGPD